MLTTAIPLALALLASKFQQVKALLFLVHVVHAFKEREVTGKILTMEFAIISRLASLVLLMVMP